MRIRQLVIVVACLFLCAGFYLFVLGPFHTVSHRLRQPNRSPSRPGGDGVYPSGPSNAFDPHGRDTLVFLHIPKTGGSDFLRHLVTLMRDGEPLCSFSQLKQKKNGKKERAYCPRSGLVKAVPTTPLQDPWFVAEKTIGWHCGLHPFYSEYLSCIATEVRRRQSIRKFDPTCKFHFTTMLRHPVLRYISEYVHVQRGATFSYRHICGGREVTDLEMPPCYPGFYNKVGWSNVTLPKFLSCASNWGNNRQTMSIADLEKVSCFNKNALSQEERDRQLLNSAKYNLKHRFSFFGLTEYEVESGLLFQETFGLKFRTMTVQKPVSELHTAPILYSLWNSNTTYHKIYQANHLDMQLYEYALDLFSSRLKEIGISLDQNRVQNEVKHLMYRGKQ